MEIFKKVAAVLLGLALMLSFGNIPAFKAHAASSKKERAGGGTGSCPATQPRPKAPAGFATGRTGRDSATGVGTAGIKRKAEESVRKDPKEITTLPGGNKT